ncbi:MAG: hypothetical protein FWD66_06760 [Paludibacter sp.]|nr:hypothetical protein [Paludibacter sp.]
MKKLVKISNVMLLAAVIFAGCKKDNNDGPTPNYAEEITGSYVGKFSMNGEVVVPDATLNIERKDNSNVMITVNQEFPIIGQLNISCPASVTKLSDTYSFSGETTVSIEALGGEFPVTISGTIAGLGVINMTISGQGLPGVVTFTGAKLQQPE